MSTKYLVAVDGGTQSTKIVIFDTDGNVVCEGKRDLRPLHLADPGIVEHPDDDLWDSFVAASREALSRFPGDVKDIIGIGLCSIRFCRVMLKADGSLAQPVVNWMDLRLARPWERENDDVRYVTTASGYMSHRLTGQFKDTAANYEGNWPIDRDTWTWSRDPEVLGKYNVPREMLLETVLPGEIIGPLTREAALASGFPEGVPVVATANDKAVEALGAGALDRGTALVSLGTYIAGMVQGDRYVADSRDFWTNMACIPFRYIYESNGIRRGMSTVSWIRNLMGGDLIAKSAELGLSPEDYLNAEAAKIPAGSDGLLTVPEWLAPPSHPYKRGVIIGFDGRHNGVHMFRSILEAIAMSMKNKVGAMCRELGMPLDRLVISGGGSNGDLFMQIFADAFGVPASRNLVNGSVSMGCAICAAVALNLHGGFDETTAKMVRPRDTFRPIPENVETYANINNGVFASITDYTDEVLKKSHRLIARKD